MGEEQFPDGRAAQVKRPAADGRPMAGVITRMLQGQGSGAIRTDDVRAVYFHRTDVTDDSAFEKLSVGDAVTFVLVEDSLSGPRAEQVRRSADEVGQGTAYGPPAPPNAIGDEPNAVQLKTDA
jgi:cold shock CspA family protein